MKLYYAPGACSLAVHIALREAGLPFSLERVDMKNGTVGVRSFREINPKGYVPALELDDGSVLTEGAAIQQYVAELAPEKNLLPQHGTMDRWRAIEWLTFITTELHKGFGPVFNPSATPEAKQAAFDHLGKRFGYVNEKLAGKEWLVGKQFTIADGYLNVVFGWALSMKVPVNDFTNILAHSERVHARPAVREARQAEGLN